MFTETILPLGGLIIGNFALVLLFLRYSRGLIYGLSMTIGAVMIILLPVSVNVFGFPFGLIEILFATFFLLTDILSELYGTRAARKALVYALGGITVGLLFVKLGAALPPSDFDLSASYLATASSLFTPFTVIVAVGGFILEQYIDIFNFDRIKHLTNGRYLWLRNCLSTITTQGLDVLIIYPLFFYAVLGAEVWKLMAAAIIFKGIMAIIDTPFMYLARRITSLEYA